MDNKIKETRVIFVSNNDQELYHAIVQELRTKGIRDDYQVKQTNIFGLNTYSSILKIYPENFVYVDVKKADIPAIVNALESGRAVKEKLYKVEHADIFDDTSVTMYHKQLRVVLRNSGLIDPESLEEYLSRDGYQGFAKVLAEMKPEDVIDEMKLSGLRGRGGGGFPVWFKWKATRGTESDVKYVICNADEGDPGAYMDRSVLEGDPHSVLEGMMIAAYAIGASKGYIYIRAEYPLAIERLNKAITDAKNCGVLGDKILGSNFSFDIELRLGAGAFVCGEETALIASIEGNRGMPKPRPPFPSVKGLWGKPTSINNVETLANVPVVFIKGGKWFNKIGTEKSKGTKVFALTGKVKHSGLVEVPMGVTLREIIYDVGGGIAGENYFKAVQTGGPSGGMIPAEYLDTSISYESLQKLGSIMGSGGMIVMDDSDCMVDVTKFYLQFTVDESCGKCAPCRIGGMQMLDTLTAISEGRGTEENLLQLASIGKAMQKASLCGLGQTAPNPVISAMRYFKEEIEAHITDNKCVAGKCKDLITYTIDEKDCIGCHLCAIRCPANCISGNKKELHVVDQAKCIKCGECFNVCKFNAVIKQ